MLRCEAPAPGLQRGAISRLSRGTSKLAPLSLLLVVVVVLLLLVQMLLVVRRGSPTRLDARVAGI